MSDLFDKGLEIRRAVLGADYVDKSLANADAAYAKLLTAPRRRVLWALLRATLTSTVWPACVSSQLPPLSPARSTMTEPGDMFRTASAVSSVGAGRPGIWAVVMITSCLAALSASASRTFSFSSSVSGRA